MTTYVLGAPDPEMDAIETLLRDARQTYCFAAVDGQRVHGGNAYRADGTIAPDGGPISLDEYDRVVLVECELAGEVSIDDDLQPVIERVSPLPVGAEVVVCDHHRPGDPGYGRPPGEFLPASSLGQVIADLARSGSMPEHWVAIGAMAPADRIQHAPGEALDPGEMYYRITGWYVGTPDYDDVPIPDELVVTAASDHCPGHAYRGECPGVDPDELAHWRAATRAEFQRRPVQEVLADVEAARDRIRAATRDQHGVVDLRGPVIPELPEAALREGVAVLAGPLDCPDGRRKVVLQAASPEQIEAFLRGEIAPELVDRYGDPARGFAGGYVEEGDS